MPDNLAPEVKNYLRGIETYDYGKWMDVRAYQSRTT